jgi:hypothetical protein
MGSAAPPPWPLFQSLRGSAPASCGVTVRTEPRSDREERDLVPRERTNFPKGVCRHPTRATLSGRLQIQRGCPCSGLVVPFLPRPAYP